MEIFDQIFLFLFFSVRLPQHQHYPCCSGPFSEKCQWIILWRQLRHRSKSNCKPGVLLSKSIEKNPQRADGDEEAGHSFIRTFGTVGEFDPSEPSDLPVGLPFCLSPSPCASVEGRRGDGTPRRVEALGDWRSNPHVCAPVGWLTNLPYNLLDSLEGC